ncbi:MAG TPA: hypothetical protein VGM43_17045 [Bryobacteraceae bacterium]
MALTVAGYVMKDRLCYHSVRQLSFGFETYCPTYGECLGLRELRSRRVEPPPVAARQPGARDS